VGAYLRDYADARTADLSFATECLAFANIPHDTTLTRMPGGMGVRVHHPAWKQRSPRDLGAGWDFDDVRDHYLAQEFKLDPMRLRYADPERYLLLGRLATGRAMAAAFAQWRRPASRCGGALVLFLRDLWAGAGWGLFDDQGVPKACMHMLAPLLAPVAIWMTDEGGNGVAVHVCNERGEALAGDFELTVLRPSGTTLTQVRRAIALDAQSAQSFNALDAFDEFIDLSCAYRFGPPGVAAVVAKLFDASGVRLSQNIYYPGGEILQVEPDISASARLTGDGYLVTLASRGLAQAVHFEADGYVASTEFFDLAPGEQREVVMRACTGYTRPLYGCVKALNSRERAPIKLVP
jgi:beta-mannosidase